ncbi:hypothetical protein BH23PLA1_BH23PLA1_10100 [soil metagenome]
MLAFKYISILTPNPKPAGNGAPLEPLLSVAYFSPGWPPESFASGIVTYIDAIAGGMRRLGHRVDVLARQLGDEPAAENVHDVSFEDRQPTPTGRVAGAVLRRLAPEAQLARLVCRPVRLIVRRLAVKGELQLLEMDEAFGWAGWLQGRVSVPVVVRLHGPWFLVGEATGAAEGVAKARRIDQEGRAIRGAAGVTAPSRFVLDQTMARHGPPTGPVEVIPNPMPAAPETDRWHPAACEPGSLLFVGRFDRLKGADLVVEAFARLRAEFPGLRLRIAGPDGGLVDDLGRPWEASAYLADRVPDAWASGDLEWLGRRPPAELRTLRSQAAVTVVASRFETFPMAVLEAMAQGVPLVAPAVGGVPELIRDGDNGLLFRGGDADDLASKLRRLLLDADLAARLGAQAARDCRRHFDPDTIAAQTAEFYRSVIARAGLRAS